MYMKLNSYDKNQSTTQSTLLNSSHAPPPPSFAHRTQTSGTLTKFLMLFKKQTLQTAEIKAGLLKALSTEDFIQKKPSR